MIETETKKLNLVKYILSGLMVLMLFIAVGLAYLGGKNRAADRIRIKNVEILAQFIQSYKKNQGVYPPAFQGKPGNYEKYLDSLPDWPNNDCQGADTYNYQTLNDGQSFRLSFCLNSRVDGFAAGTHAIGPNDLQ